MMCVICENDDDRDVDGDGHDGGHHVNVYAHDNVHGPDAHDLFAIFR